MKKDKNTKKKQTKGNGTLAGSKQRKKVVVKKGGRK